MTTIYAKNENDELVLVHRADLEKVVSGGAKDQADLNAAVAQLKGAL